MEVAVISIGNNYIDLLATPVSCTFNTKYISKVFNLPDPTFVKFHRLEINVGIIILK